MNTLLLWALGVAFVLAVPVSLEVADHNACTSLPGNTWTLFGGCHWPPLNLGNTP
jgi:hypothetical protein